MKALLRRADAHDGITNRGRVLKRFISISITFSPSASLLLLGKLIGKLNVELRRTKSI